MGNLQSQLELYDQTFHTVLDRAEYNKPLLCAICSYLGPAIYAKDSAKVACSKKTELQLIKESFLIGKLGLADSPELDEAIKETCQIMGSSNRNKYRAVFYYLLVERYEKEHLFTTPSETSDEQAETQDSAPEPEEEPVILTEEDIKNENSTTNQIILEHALMAAGVGMVPLPVIDMFGISTVQYKMIKKLSDEYDHLNFDEQRTNGLLAAMFSGFSSMELGLVARLFFKGIPVVGPLLGGTAVSAYAYTMTKIVGEVFDEHFAAGGGLELTEVMKKKVKARLKKFK